MAHKKSDYDIKSNATNKSEYSCRNCLNAFNNNNELNQHIITEHKSYKPCRTFSTNSCQYLEECRFYHIILKQGESICYKCGDRFSKKSILLSHLKNDHNEPCLRFQEGTCSYGIKCIYKHIITGVTKVVRPMVNSEYESPHIDSHSDFPYLPATEKRLVGTQGSTEQLMINMNNILTQMSQIMTRLEKVMSPPQ